MSWDFYIRQFKNYLKLERSLSDNSVEAYIRDVLKLRQFSELNEMPNTPIETTSDHIQEFIEYINNLGMTPHSQASFKQPGLMKRCGLLQASKSPHSSLIVGFIIFDVSCQASVYENVFIYLIYKLDS